MKRLLFAFFTLLVVLTSTSRPTIAARQPLVLAFYYAWFDQNVWSLTKIPDLPTLKYLSNDPTTIARQIQMAQGAGIDVFVVSWWGAANPTDVNFRTMLDVSAAMNFKTAADFEITAPSYRNRGDIVNSLKNLLSTYANHPGYLRVGGKPVIFFWRDKGGSIARGLDFSVDEWRAIRNQVDPNHTSLWINEGIDTSYLSVFDGHHLYSIAWSPNVFAENTKWPRRVKAFGADKIWIATVMPGNDDRKTHRPDSYVRDRENGEFYRQTWRAAFATNPDWIIITSWNEWVEGTMIEPSVTYGDLYLNITREFAAKFHAGLPTPTPTLSPTPKPTATSTRTPTLPVAPVSTVAPTAAPEPSDDSSPATQVAQNTDPGGIRAKTTDALRVRAEPNTSAAILALLRQGADIILFLRTDDGKWFQTQLPNSDRRGWVASDFISTTVTTESLPIFQVPPSAATTSPTEAPATDSPSEPTPADADNSPTPTPTPTLKTPLLGFPFILLPFMP